MISAPAGRFLRGERSAITPRKAVVVMSYLSHSSRRSRRLALQSINGNNFNTSISAYKITLINEAEKLYPISISKSIYNLNSHLNVPFYNVYSHYKKEWLVKINE